MQRHRNQAVIGEFHLRTQNSRLAPLRIRWEADESLYYGGTMEVLGGPVGLKSRFENRMTDRSWMKNNPDHVAGGRPFTESYYATVAVLVAFSDTEKVQMEFVRSPVPNTSSNIRTTVAGGYRDIEEFDRGEKTRTDASTNDNDRRNVSGSLRAG